MTFVDLSALTTFKTVARAAELIELNDTAQLATISERLQGQAFIVLGSGSNVLFAEDYAGIVVVNRLRGKRVLTEDDNYAVVQIAAGEIWHDVVCDMSQRGYYGLENLALIPGTAGAAPVQNIGAYAVEIADFVESVQVFDLSVGKMRELHAADCGFAYRDSVFKREPYRRRYLITGITLRLHKTFAPVLSYQGLNLKSDNDDTLTPKALLQRVIAVRRSKLPDPQQLPNAGSFFKNPVIHREQLTRLQRDYPSIPYFNIDDAQVKIPAAWLIEAAGFKGVVKDSGAGVYDKHALILVNHGQAHGRDIYALACEIMLRVETLFGLAITPEVRIIGA